MKLLKAACVLAIVIALGAFASAQTPVRAGQPPIVAVPDPLPPEVEPEQQQVATPVRESGGHFTITVPAGSRRMALALVTDALRKQGCDPQIAVRILRLQSTPILPNAVPPAGTRIFVSCSGPTAADDKMLFDYARSSESRKASLARQNRVLANQRDEARGKARATETKLKETEGLLADARKQIANLTNWLASATKKANDYKNRWLAAATERDAARAQLVGWRLFMVVCIILLVLAIALYARANSRINQLTTTRTVVEGDDPPPPDETVVVHHHRPGRVRRALRFGFDRT